MAFLGVASLIGVIVSHVILLFAQTTWRAWLWTARDRNHPYWSGRTLLWRVGELFPRLVFNYPTLAEAYKVAALGGLNKL